MILPPLKLPEKWSETMESLKYVIPPVHVRRQGVSFQVFPF